MDARSKRAYTNVYENGIAVNEDSVKECEEIRNEYNGEEIIGDGRLIGREYTWPDICANFLAVKDRWERMDNVHLTVPEYLKSSESYMVKK